MVTLAAVLAVVSLTDYLLLALQAFNQAGDAEEEEKNLADKAAEMTLKNKKEDTQAVEEVVNNTV